MPSYFYAVTFLYRLCGHVFMQYASIPPMRPLFCAVLSCGRAFALSCFSMRTKPLHSHAFTQLNPLRRRILMRLRPLHGDILIRPHSYAAALFMQPCFYAVLDGKGSQGGQSCGENLRGISGDGPAPVRRYGSVVPAGPLLSRQAEGDGTPAVFSTDGVHGALQFLLLFLLLGDYRGRPTDPAAGRSRRCR